MRSLTALPKVHVHAHLDGSYPREAVLALARRRGVPLDLPVRGGPAATGEGWSDVWAFFEAYGRVPALVADLDDLAGLCRALVAQEAAEGVVYLEPAIEPQLYAPRLGSLREVTRVVVDALGEAGREHSVEVGAILTLNTDQDEPIAAELAAVAAEFAGRGVTAFGTAGFEEPSGLQPLHRGGRDGPGGGVAGRRPRRADRRLGVRRGGHRRPGRDPHLPRRPLGREPGLRAAPRRRGHRLRRRPRLQRGAGDRRPTLASHPAPALHAAGVGITLNADDQLWFGRGVSDQYALAREVWGLRHRPRRPRRARSRIEGMSPATRHRLGAGLPPGWRAARTGVPARDNVPLLLSAFEINAPNLTSQGLWAHPEQHTHATSTSSTGRRWPGCWRTAVSTCCSWPTPPATPCWSGRTPEVAFEQAVEMPTNDPLLLVPAMAAVTSRLGFAVTSSTSLETPYPNARRFATLDHLTRGRIGWNVVTTSSTVVSDLHGRAPLAPHDERYDIADEHLHLSYRLFEGSWEDGAVLHDKATRRYADARRVHEVHHRGRYFRCDGYFKVEPSPQRTPVVFQAGASERGREFAATHAEVVFLQARDAGTLRAQVLDLHARAARHGRGPGSLRTLVGLSVVLGRDGTTPAPAWRSTCPGSTRTPPAPTTPR